MIKKLLLSFLIFASAPSWGEGLYCGDGRGLYEHFVEYREKLLLGWLGSDDLAYYFSEKLTEDTLSKLKKAVTHRDIGAAIDGYYHAVREGSSIRIVFQSSVETLKPKRRLDLVMAVYTDFMLDKLREGGRIYPTRVKVEYACEKGVWKIIGMESDARKKVTAKLDTNEVLDIFMTRQEYQGVSWAWFVDEIMGQTDGQFGWD